MSGKIELNTPTTINDQAFQRVTTPEPQIVAHTTDPFAAQSADQTGKQLLEALNSFNEGADYYGKAKERTDKVEQEKGAASAMRGEPLDQSATRAFARGYETLKGKAALSDLNEQYSEWVAKNPEATTEEWSQARNEIVKNFVNGRSDAFLQGFIPEALELEKRYDLHVTQTQAALLKQESMTNAQKAMNLDLATALNDHSAQQKENLKALQATMTQMKAAGATDAQLSSYQSAFMETQNNNLAEKMRGILTNAQETALPTGISRAETAKMFVDLVGRKAGLAGSPELLKFAEVPDPSGVRLTDNPALSDDIVKYTEHAIATQRTNRTMAKEQYNEDRKQAQDLFERLIVSDMMDLQLHRNDDPSVIKQKLGALNQKIMSFSTGTPTEFNPRGFAISGDKMDSFRKSLNDMMFGDGLNVKTNPSVYAEKAVKAWMGQLTWDDVRSAKDDLSPTDQTSLLKTSLERSTALMNHGESQDQALFQRYVGGLQDIVGQKDSLMGFLDQDSPKRRLMAEHEMVMRWMALKQENPNARLDPTTLQKWADESESAVLKKYPKANVAMPQTPQEKKQTINNMFDSLTGTKK